MDGNQARAMTIKAVMCAMSSAQDDLERARLSGWNTHKANLNQQQAFSDYARHVREWSEVLDWIKRQ